LTQYRNILTLFLVFFGLREGFFIMIELTKREKDILQWVVQSYIETTIPVGSHYLVGKYQLNLSSATVRNEMANLERLGYIKPPHTSAGRIPTDKGYRFYVNGLMQREQLSQEEQENICEQIEEAKGDVKRILGEASKILGKISMELGVVLTPWMAWGIFDRMELVGLSQRKVLAVLHVRSRFVKTVIMELESDLKQKDLELTESILNERLSGLTLEEIKRTIHNRTSDIVMANKMLMKRFVESAPMLFEFSEPHDVHTSGTKNILNQPEFSDVHALEHILGLIDDREGLIHLFHRDVQETEVTIGRENQDKRLRFCSVVAARYKRGKDVGTLGVIGPTRMRYSKILPLVEVMAGTMSQYLS